MTSAGAYLRRIDRQLVADAGWRSGSDIEDAISARLLRWRCRSCLDATRLQFRVDGYRVDFAWVDGRFPIALEVDGYHHRATDEQAARDRDRDAFLRGLGWVVLRIDDSAGVDAMIDQLSPVLGIVHAIRGCHGRM